MNIFAYKEKYQNVFHPLQWLLMTRPFYSFGSPSLFLFTYIILQIKKTKYLWEGICQLNKLKIKKIQEQVFKIFKIQDSICQWSVSNIL